MDDADEEILDDVDEDPTEDTTETSKNLHRVPDCTAVQLGIFVSVNHSLRSFYKYCMKKSGKISKITDRDRWHAILGAYERL